MSIRNICKVIINQCCWRPMGGNGGDTCSWWGHSLLTGKGPKTIHSVEMNQNVIFPNVCVSPNSWICIFTPWDFLPWLTGSLDHISFKVNKYSVNTGLSYFSHNNKIKKNLKFQYVKNLGLICKQNTNWHDVL